VALLATYTFLAVNGRLLDADETEIAETIESVASGRVSEPALTNWIAARVRS
jgi:prophage maintenance system killer protein